MRLITRRTAIVTGVAAATAAALPAYAIDDHPPVAGEFQYKNPGAAPLDRGFNPEVRRQALPMLFAGLVPANIGSELAAMPEQGRYRYENVYLHRRSSRMGFLLNGKIVMVANTVAMTTSPRWQQVSHKIYVWKVQDRQTGTVYSLEWYEVCGNWTLTIRNMMGECVRDETLCRADCKKDLETLRRLQG